VGRSDGVWEGHEAEAALVMLMVGRFVLSCLPLSEVRWSLVGGLAMMMSRDSLLMPF
jgi:hypothetical protein